MLGHGCARVAHCVTARWRNFSHYCRPLRHYDVWLRVLITEKHWQPRRQHTVYRSKRLEFATEQVGKLRYVIAVDGGLKRFSWVAWYTHPCVRLSHGRLARWRKWRACDVGELIFQPFRHFTYVTAHSPTLPVLYLRHGSFSNPSFAAPTS